MYKILQKLQQNQKMSLKFSSISMLDNFVLSSSSLLQQNDQEKLPQRTNKLVYKLKNLRTLPKTETVPKNKNVDKKAQLSASYVSNHYKGNRVQKTKRKQKGCMQNKLSKEHLERKKSSKTFRRVPSQIFQNYRSVSIDRDKSGQKSTLKTQSREKKTECSREEDSEFRTLMSRTATILDEYQLKCTMLERQRDSYRHQYRKAIDQVQNLKKSMKKKCQ